MARRGKKGKAGMSVKFAAAADKMAAVSGSMQAKQSGRILRRATSNMSKGTVGGNSNSDGSGGSGHGGGGGTLGP